MRHEVRDGIIHKPMPCKAGLRSKDVANNQDMKVPSAFGRTGMPNMVLGLIPDLQGQRGQYGPQTPLEFFAQAHG
jgi:hypothetical protein